MTGTPPDCPSHAGSRPVASVENFIKSSRIRCLKRIMFDSRIADTSADCLAGIARQLSSGDRCKASVVLDSVVDLNIIARYVSLTDDALAKGTRRLCGVHFDSS